MAGLGPRGDCQLLGLGGGKVDITHAFNTILSLRLTLLAPDIVEAIQDGRQPPGLQLDDLLVPFPMEWARQRIEFVAD